MSAFQKEWPFDLIRPSADADDDIEWQRLAEAWANVMDGRQIVWHGPRYSTAARIGRDTTTADDWHAIAAEYARLRDQA